MDKEHEPYEKAKLLYSNEHEMIEAILTFLGTSVTLAMFIHDSLLKKPKTISDNVRYALALTIANFRAFSNAHANCDFEKVSFPLLKESGEQQIESMRRKLNIVIEFLYQSLQEEKKAEEEMKKYG